MVSIAHHNEEETVNFLALLKNTSFGEEKYLFLYSDENKYEAFRTLGRFASDPELSFNWYDAAVLSQKIRKLAEPEEKMRERNTLESISQNCSS